MQRTTPKKFVFVLMPFDKRFDDVYELGIEAACKAAGAYCERVDKQIYRGTILERVYNQIAKADLIISDMTGRNANVFYETGYAHALGKNVILLAQHERDIPFDTKHYPHIVYKGEIAELKKRLRQQVGWYLKQPDTRADAQGGVSSIHASRRDAAGAFEELVRDRKTTLIYISGISLRDFLTEQGVMRGVWKAVKKRLAEESAGDLPAEERLRVRLLLLDPQSGEGFFRYKIEKPLAIGKHGDVKASDIESGLNEIEETVGEIYEGRQQDFLEARLYEHSPFSFIFLANSSAFVEQYCYKLREEGVGLPTIKYDVNSRQYQQLQTSLGIVWEHARPSRSGAGVATAIEVAKVRNIYRVDKRREQERRQVESIYDARAGTVDILSITGRFFSDRERDAVKALAYVSSPKRKKQVKVRFAVLSPVCQQAIFRAVADGCPVGEIPNALKKYSWNAYRKRSNLYDGVHKTLTNISHLMEEGHSVELRLYSCSTTNSLLLTPASAFVGTYIYGRSKGLQESDILKSEYPVIEYSNVPSKKFDNTEQEILKCTFEVIWSYYSITYGEYEARVYPHEEEEFNKNLTRIREELGLISPEK